MDRKTLDLVKLNLFIANLRIFLFKIENYIYFLIILFYNK